MSLLQHHLYTIMLSPLFASYYFSKPAIVPAPFGAERIHAQLVQIHHVKLSKTTILSQPSWRLVDESQLELFESKPTRFDEWGHLSTPQQRIIT